jgi:dihydroorotate dehydrogenase (NAD+) catalytic subunit
MANIDTIITGIRLANPLMLASGILDENGYTMKKILEAGASAVVTKSIGRVERTGYRPPIIAEIPGGLLNAVGLANPGIDNFDHEVEIALQAGKPIIGSIFGGTPDDFLYVGKKMEQYGASALELNLSCPHVLGVGSEVGSDPELVEEIIGELKKKIKIPLWAKLSPNVTDILKIAEAAQKADAFVLINTVRGMAIDIYARRPVLSNAYGGLSGRAIKNVGIRYVYQIRKETGKPIIGVGGIETHEDAIEYIMAGATALEIGTGVYSRGKGIFSEINKGLSSFMESEGFSSINDMVGVAVQ